MPKFSTPIASGAATPADIVARSYARIRAHDDPAIFITLRDEEDVLAEAKALAASGDKSLPLYGIPVAVKDNIDVAGMPTTAACPAYLYRARQDATAVARLRAAGALILGKTNLDQFATGLVGVRIALRHRPQSVRRKTHSRRIEHGFGAGGRAPASCRCRSAPIPRDRAACRRRSAISSGLKPSLGLVSTAGVVPACRTLDCVSVFALTVDDAVTALKADRRDRIDADPYSRARPLRPSGRCRTA